MKDDAVSEIVGVMIMLSITLILAAIIASTVSSIGSNIHNPINAELNYAGETDDNYIFEMKSGDGFSLSDLKVVYRKEGDVNAFSSYSSDDFFAASDNVITVGDRFTVQKPSFEVMPHDRIIYQFYDRNSGTPISAGNILAGL
ncbi:MAG TPA: type IV pilin N-terminal domain-containing protein [Methanocorpusculum sp.]|nr:type IV pilin N-terminal domain-containing protein [Methanocorpusculum sp.]